MFAKCGSCGSTHETILDYRDCAGATSEAESAVKVMDDLTGQPATLNPPSDKQVKYVMDLLSVRDWPDAYTAEQLKGMERRQVSTLIGELLKSVIRPEKIEVPSGWYALRKPDESWGFWQVESITHGKWAGHSFVSQLVGSPGDYKRQKVAASVAKGILSKVKEITPAVASADFGRQSGTCGICHSPLTNAASLERGIGPICAGKMGW